jgi:hypothetical protein
MKGLPNLYERPALTPYFDAQLWKTGTGALITGPPGSGKTRTGVALLKAVYKVEPILQQYWTEHDFLADLRYLWRLEDLTKNDRNEMLWMEYVEWEQAFWGFKQCPFLFLDNVGEGYTAMHRYEVMNLLRLRLDMALPTVVAVDSSQMESLTPQFKSLLIRSAVMVGVSGDGEG